MSRRSVPLQANDISMILSAAVLLILVMLSVDSWQRMSRRVPACVSATPVDAMLAERKVCRGEYPAPPCAVYTYAICDGVKVPPGHWYDPKTRSIRLNRASWRKPHGSGCAPVVATAIGGQAYRT